LKPLGGGSNAFELQLSNVPTTLTEFTDRPARQVDTETVSDFVDNWEARGFAQDPPNAAIVFDQVQTGRNSIVAELFDPRYDADAGTLTYRAEVLDDVENQALSPAADSIDHSPPARFGSAHLFIDSGGATEHFLLFQYANLSDDVQLTFDSSTTTTLARQGVQYGAAASTSALLQNAQVAAFPDRISFGAPQPSRGLVQASVLSTADTISGTAQIPSGATLTVSVDGGGPQPIKSGPFSLSTGG